MHFAVNIITVQWYFKTPDTLYNIETKFICYFVVEVDLKFVWNAMRDISHMERPLKLDLGLRKSGEPRQP